MGIRQSLLFCPLALAGTLTVLYMSAPWGIGLSPDSTTYVRVARRLFPGTGFDEIAHSTFPPLYPIVLALGAKLGIEVLDGARWLNAIVFGANILLVGLVIRRQTNSVPAGLLGSFFTATGIGVLIVHSMAWSEPLFLLFTVLGLALLATHLAPPKTPWALYAAAAATALASLDRYPGVALTAAGSLAILFVGGGDGKSKARDALVFGGISVFPVGLWILHSMRVAGGPAGRQIVYHPISPQQYQGALDTLVTWLLPAALAHAAMRHPWPAFIFGVVTLGTIATAIAVTRGRWHRHVRGFGTSSHAARTPGTDLPMLLALFVVVYAALLVVALSFTDIGADLGQRPLSPIYVCGLMLTVSLVHRRVRFAGAMRPFGWAALAFGVALAISYCLQARSWVIAAHGAGLEYAGKRWKQSPIMHRVRDLPPSIGIYTNRPDAIYMLTGRSATIIPAKVDDMTGLKNEHYASEIGALRRRLQTGPTVLVYVVAWPPSVPTEAELRDTIPLRLIAGESDGSVYAW